MGINLLVKFVISCACAFLLTFTTLAQAAGPNKPKLQPLSPELLQKVKVLMEKPSTWDNIPKNVNLCLFVPDGPNGSLFQYARSYISELPRITRAASDIGINLDVEMVDQTNMVVKIASKKMGRSSTTNVKFSLYTDERIVAEDFRQERCDGAAMSNMRARKFNPFVGSLDAIGAIPDYKHLSTAIKLLAHPKLNKYMVNKDYEVTGIMPVGAAYIFVNDRSINTLAKAAGKKVAVLDFDKSQEIMVSSIGAQPVSSDITTFGRKFNNGEVDIIASPTILYQPLELYKGLNRKGDAKGAIINFPLTQLTVVALMHRDRFPEGIGQLVREASAANLDPAYEFISKTENKIPDKYWLDIPPADKPGYEKLMRQNRINMMQKGFYHPKMMQLLKNVRCKYNPKHYECSLNDE